MMGGVGRLGGVGKGKELGDVRVWKNCGRMWGVGVEGKGMRLEGVGLGCGGGRRGGGGEGN
jgi:hypothetical protein